MTQSVLGDGSFDPRGVFVFIDESYEPYVAAAATSFEAVDVFEVEREVRTSFESLAEDYQLRGLASYDQFLEKGFHATDDTTEVSTVFVRYLARASSFKTSIVFSEGRRRSDLSPKRRLMVVFETLLRDVLRQHRGRSEVTLVFESAESMDVYIRRIVERVRKRLGRRAPRVQVEFRSKRDPHLLAVPDYVLHIFGAWLASQATGDALRIDPTSFRSRDLRAVLGSISEARSIDGTTVIRRTDAPALLGSESRERRQ